MSQIRNWVLASVVAGFGLVAVGCGPAPSTAATGNLKDKYDQNTEKFKEGKEGAEKGLKDGANKLDAGAKELLDKAKEEVTNQYNAIEKAIAALTKAKSEEKDAVKASALGKIETDAKGMFASLGDKIKEFAKDPKSLESIKTSAMEMVKKLKEMLKDYMPK